MLNGLNAIVTGSTSGIGLAMASALAKAGANVMLNGLGDADEIEKTRAGLAAETGKDICYNAANMLEPAEIRAMVAEAEERWGSVDILVNNAGIQHVSPVEEFPDDKWDAIIGINLSSAFHCIKAVMPGMKARGFGRIINLASAHALVASPYKVAYVAAKHGIAGITKTVALEVAKEGITVNAICPGYVLTPLVEKQIPDTAKARGISEDEVINNVMLAGQPTKEFVGTDEIGEMAVFLSRRENKSITGAILSIDGGWVAQ
jgi:3-hydroxybutyrate dehydrogenase